MNRSEMLDKVCEVIGSSVMGDFEWIEGHGVFVKVVGTTFSKKGMAVLESGVSQEEIELYLKYEDDNKYDENAIAVMVSKKEDRDKSLRVGYLAKELAKEVRKFPSKMDVRGWTIDIGSGKYNSSLMVEIDVVEGSDGDEV